MSVIYRFLALLLLGMGMSMVARAADEGAEATLDRTRILEGETVLLTLRAPGDSWGVPDLGALDKDFAVTNQGQSTSMSIVNGHASSTRKWQFLLAPKRTGHLAVPAMKIGQLTSTPLSLEVLPAAQAGELGETLPVMLEAEVDKEAPYVQGQVVYRVLVLVRVSLTQATLEDPSGEGLVVERLGEDRRYETQRNGQRYQAIERRYVLFPQHSGPLAISPPVLNGSVPEREGGQQGERERQFGGTAKDRFDRFFGRDPFGDVDSLFQRSRPVQVRGPTLTLDVRPRPADAASPWLPAESLQLSETWDPEPRELHLGEPIARTVAITAQGLTAAQLPDLTPPATDGLKVYPDQPRTETHADGDTLVSVKELKVAMVPTDEGALTLPEVRLAWWDTTTDRERVAVLPARVVRVLPARSSASLPAARAPTPLPDTDTSTEPRAVRGPSIPLPAPPPRGQPPEPANASAADGTAVGLPFPAGHWPWISAALALAWLLTLGLWLRERRRSTTAGATVRGGPEKTAPPSPVAAKSFVRAACEANDPRAARDALLAWAAVRWPEDAPRRLEDLARRLDGPAGEALRALDRSLYSDEVTPWDGRGAWALLSPALGRGRETGDGGKATLPPLYPRETP